MLAAIPQGFEINDQTGRPLTDKDMMEKHHSRVHVLQKVVFEHYRQALPDFPFVSSVAAGKVRESLVLSRVDVHAVAFLQRGKLVFFLWFM